MILFQDDKENCNKILLGLNILFSDDSEAILDYLQILNIETIKLFMTKKSHTLFVYYILI